jgi:hypothetical protein
MPDPEEPGPRREGPDEPRLPSLEDELFGMDPMAGEERADRDPGPPRLTTPGRHLPSVRLAWPLRRTGAGPSPRDVVAAISGFATFALVDCVMMYGPSRMRDSPTLLPQMVTLLVLAFGLGGLFVWGVRGAGRWFGVGMMLGWAALTLVSAGYLTGLNP